MRPPILADIDDVVIDDVWAETWSAEQYLFHLDNDWGVAIFGTEDNLRFNGTCSEIYLDGTFKTAPHPYEQMFTIHGKYRDRVIMFCVAFLTGKLIGQYREVLAAIKRELRRLTGHRWRPRRAIMDFEHGLMAAIQTELHRTRVFGCYFHFCKSMWRKIQELGLSGAYRRSSRLKKCIKKVMALGYLPVALVRQNFDLLTNRRRTRRLVIWYPALQDFFNYVRNNYFNGLFPTTYLEHLRPGLW